MVTRLSDLGKGLAFYGIVFALVVGLAFVPVDGQTMLLVAMLLPALGVLLMLLVVTDDAVSRCTTRRARSAGSPHRGAGCRK